MIVCQYFFFFQAEDGIRDPLVTGVQTCALPILSRPARSRGAEGSRGRGVGQTSGEQDRKSVVEGKSVDLGGRRIIKTKKEKVGVHRPLSPRRGSEPPGHDA